MVQKNYSGPVKDRFSTNSMPGTMHSVSSFLKFQVTSFTHCRKDGGRSDFQPKRMRR